jgi:hypothetical protein
MVLSPSFLALRQLPHRSCPILYLFIIDLLPEPIVGLENSDLINWELSFFLRFSFGHLLSAFLTALFASFRSRAALQLEILALRHQLGVLQRSVKRPKLTPEVRSGLADANCKTVDMKSRSRHLRII